MKQLIFLTSLALASTTFAMRESCDICEVIDDFPTAAIGINTNLTLEIFGRGGITGVAFFRCDSATPLPIETKTSWQNAIDDTPQSLKLLKNCFVKGSWNTSTETENVGACLLTQPTQKTFSMDFFVRGDNSARDVEKFMKVLQDNPNGYYISFMTCSGVNKNIASGWRKVTLIVDEEGGDTNTTEAGWRITATAPQSERPDDIMLAFNINTLTGIK